MIKFFILLIIATSLVEIALVYLKRGRIQKFSGIALAVVIIGVSTAVLLDALSSWSIIFSFFSVFRVINILRLFDGRKQPAYLRSVYLRTSQFLSLYQLIILTLALLATWFGVKYQAKWYLLAAFELISALVIYLSFNRSSQRSLPLKTNIHLADSGLPSITVAIPARNETIDLDECLTSLIGSDYPKMEILVLDDCSQEKKTPEIIRQFAQDGVRFVAGTPPPDSYSAKNFAYQQLVEEANGKYIIFCGVDTRFSNDTLRKMVEVMIAKNKSMISFIPVNKVPSGNQLKTVSLQPWRYFWEMGLPRRRLNRPPVLSTCWLVEKSKLVNYGGFKAVSRNVLPERYFAGQAIKQNDGYSFVQSDNFLGLYCQKSYPEQYSTAIRTHYPALKQRMELASLLALIETLIFVFPLSIVYIGLTHGFIVLFNVGIISLVINAITFYKVVELTYQKPMPLSLLLTPFMALFDVSMLLSSMWQYEFGEVIWKGRNVCIPVMRVEAKLPNA